MSRLLAPPLEPGCPWSGWTPPNVDWCEAELCGWIVNPADTYSNAAIVLAGIWMWRSARRTGRADLALFGPAAVATGLFSALYHASYTWFFQFFDFVGMFAFCFAVVTLNARRLGWVSAGRQTRFYVLGVVAMSALVPLLFETGVPIQLLVMALVAAIFWQEFRLSRRSTGAVRYEIYLGAMVLLAAAGTFSLLDVTRAWCDPHDHFVQGHAIWHLLSAASFVVLYLFYERLPEFDGHGMRYDGYR